MEFDIDNDGELEFITYSPYSIRFFEKDLSIIDAINTENSDDQFRANMKPVTIKGINYLIMNISKKHEGEVWLVNVRKDGSVFKKVLYSFYSGSNPPRNNAYALVVKDLLIVYITIDFPLKHDYKKIIAFDINNFNIKWIKYSADFPSALFTNRYQPNCFYYTTLAWLNQVYFSNNTYYDTDVETNKIYIDTTFADRIYPKPDENAPDYSCDSASYLVKMDLAGNIVFRKRTGSKFQHLELVDNSNENFSILFFNDRKFNKHKLLLFDKQNDILRSIYNINVELKSELLTGRLGDYYYSATPGKLQFFDIAGDSTVLLKENFFEDRLVGKFVGNYFIGLTENNIYKIFDKDLNYLSFIPAPENGFYQFYWSNILNSLVIKGKNRAYIAKFKELNLLERITPEGMRFITYSAFGGIIILLAFWIVTMRISKKKIVEQNEQLVNQQRELELATSQLIRSEKLAALGTVAASFAHQLNSPIGAIINSAERLKDRLTDENLDLIYQSGVHCKNVIQRFLIASRLPKEDKSTCCDLEEVLNDWLKLYKDEFISHKIDFVIELEHQSKKVAINKSELHEIFTSVIFNAKDAIIDSNSDERKIIINTFDNEKYLKIIFEDTGSGFKDNDTSQYLDAFYTTKSVGTGTGLGLWITKKIIEKAGGKIALSNNGKGARVEIELPYC